jgi:tetratricopeptide (TPR) repeat protein
MSACVHSPTVSILSESSVPAVPEQAIQFHAEGRAAGARGELEAALRLLTEAAAMAPTWPNPIYDRAFTHLLREEYAAALADYQKTLELSPRGFFTASAAVQTLEREARGELPEGIYLAYTTLEWEEDKTKVREVLEQVVERFPAFSPAWLKLSSLVEDPHERLRLLDRGLAASPDRDTKWMLILNKSQVLLALGENEASQALLRDVLADPERSLAAEAWAKVLTNDERP